MTKRKSKYRGLWEAFLDGVLRGLAAPGSVFRPMRVSVDVDGGIVKSAYRPVSEDVENIRGYFERVIGRAEQEATAVAAK